jgi:hypothetical protein
MQINYEKPMIFLNFDPSPLFHRFSKSLLGPHVANTAPYEFGITPSNVKTNHGQQSIHNTAMPLVQMVLAVSNQSN